MVVRSPAIINVRETNLKMVYVQVEVLVFPPPNSVDEYVLFAVRKIDSYSFLSYAFIY